MPTGKRPPHPVLPLRAEAWLTDPAVRSLSLAARGLQHDLLCYAWVNGSIPANTVALARVTHLAVPEFEHLWEEVAHTWHPAQAGSQHLVNDMLQDERAKYSKQAKRRSQAASKAAQARWGHKQAPAPSTKRRRAGSKVGSYDEAFETLWQAYPRRAGGNPKKGAHRAYLATLNRGIKSKAMLDGTQRYARFCTATKKEGTEYVMMAATFLGPNEHWAEPWTVPKGKAAQQPSLDLRRIQQ